jgi:hypothetical protein
VARIALAAAGAALLAGSLVGCSSKADPSPTPSASKSAEATATKGYTQYAELMLINAQTECEDPADPNACAITAWYIFPGDAEGAGPNLLEGRPPIPEGQADGFAVRDASETTQNIVIVTSLGAFKFTDVVIPADDQLAFYNPQGETPSSLMVTGISHPGEPVEAP